ncbi:uncharacterized protein LOC117642112 [Thrips palmi]|uniref:Uncharacterized protein LOC117642112 n=1 Tax=Thrips palmi TaxID=161013 RepID=A0A6P8YG18_THRPL|nr:uncharacterized protein LOC117642112 [Thrips palmi]
MEALELACQCAHDRQCQQIAIMEVPTITLPEGEEVCLLSDTDMAQLLWGVSAEEIVPSVSPSEEIVSSVGVRDNGESPPKQVVAVKKETKPRRKGRQHRVQQKKQTCARKAQPKLTVPTADGCKLGDCPHLKIVLENLINVIEAQKLCQKFISKIKRIKI